MVPTKLYLKKKIWILESVKNLTLLLPFFLFLLLLPLLLLLLVNYTIFPPISVTMLELLELLEMDPAYVSPFFPILCLLTHSSPLDSFLLRFFSDSINSSSYSWPFSLIFPSINFLSTYVDALDPFRILLILQSGKIVR